MTEITIKQEEVNLPNGNTLRVRLLRFNDEYEVLTEQTLEGLVGTPFEAHEDGWRTCVWTNHTNITRAMQEYANRLESLKKRGF